LWLNTIFDPTRMRHNLRKNDYEIEEAGADASLHLLSLETVRQCAGFRIAPPFIHSLGFRVSGLGLENSGRETRDSELKISFG